MSDPSPPRIIACPACGAATAFAASNRWRPFCSERCRITDLGAWASETYRIPAPPGEEDRVDDNDPHPNPLPGERGPA